MRSEDYGSCLCQSVCPGSNFLFIRLTNDSTHLAGSEDPLIFLKIFRCKARAPPPLYGQVQSRLFYTPKNACASASMRPIQQRNVRWRRCRCEVRELLFACGTVCAWTLTRLASCHLIPPPRITPWLLTLVVLVCAHVKYVYIQWNLRARNTLGLIVLSLVERLSLYLGGNTKVLAWCRNKCPCREVVSYQRFHCIPELR